MPEFCVTRQELEDMNKTFFKKEHSHLYEKIKYLIDLYDLFIVTASEHNYLRYLYRPESFLRRFICDLIINTHERIIGNIDTDNQEYFLKRYNALISEIPYIISLLDEAAVNEDIFGESMLDHTSIEAIILVLFIS